MKRYEKMSKEEIIEFLTNHICGNCKAYEYCKITNEYCEVVRKNWLNEEIEMKPRWATIQSNEDLDSLFKEFVDTTTMPYSAFVSWLKEEVEI